MKRFDKDEELDELAASWSIECVIMTEKKKKKKKKKMMMMMMTKKGKGRTREGWEGMGWDEEGHMHRSGSGLGEFVSENAWKAFC